MKYKILIADDNPNSIEGVRLLLQAHLDIESIYVESAKKAVEAVKADPYGFAAVVLDFHFEEENTTGADVAKDLFKINQKIQIIICTGSQSMKSVLESLRARVTDFIPKANIENVIHAVRNCFDHYDQTLRCLRKEKQTLVSRYAENEDALREIGMIGRSEKMRAIYETIKKTADNKATVLIRGECGTGKELVAQALHKFSSRSSYNFVPINCSAIPESLLESELFGHEKGAFTGAMLRKIGKFELAHRGTIFLDEIGDMPPILQATKYLGGHSDITAGTLMGRKDLIQAVWPWRKNLGQVPSPEVCSLLSRSLKTLSVRVRQQNETAMTLAKKLRELTAIEEVRYPGLATFPQFHLAKEQMSGFGGMITIVLKGKFDDAARFVDHLKLFTIAPSLGGSESLVTMPVTTTHYGLDAAAKQERGISDTMIRLSVGLESADDLWADLLQAIKA